MSFITGMAMPHRQRNIEFGGGGGASEPLQAIFSNVVLLVHGSGAPGGVLFPDSSSFNVIPTVTGAITTETDANALEGSAIRNVSANATQKDVRYAAANFINNSEAFTFEFFFEPMDQFGSIAIGSNLHFAIAGVWLGVNPIASLSFGGVTPLTRFGVFSTPGLLAPQVSTAARRFFSASRNAGAGGAIVCRLDGVPVGTVTTNAAINGVRIGTFSAVSGFTTGAFTEQIRLTRNQNLYPDPLATYIVPTAPFPNS